MKAKTSESFEVPPRHPTSTFYTDDSGVKAGGSRILVVGGIKVRRHGNLMRTIRHIRDEASFHQEFKFTALNKGSLSAFYTLIDALEHSDAHLVATVTHRPRGAGWEFYGEVTTRLIRGNINRNELVAVNMDHVSTPRHVAIEDVVRTKVNARLGSTRVVSVACLDSRTSDGLQVADLVASAIAFERRLAAGESGRPNSPKARVVNRLKEAFGVADLTDRRTGRVNIHTWAPAPRLQVVSRSA